MGTLVAKVAQAQQYVIGFFVSVLWATGSTASLIEVPSQYADIGSAMGVVQWGDSVLVAPGFYFEAVSLPAGVSLLSTSGRDSTYIGPQDGQPALTFLSGPAGNTLCQGFFLSQPDDWGWSPVISSNPDAVIEDCKIYSAGSADNFWPLVYLGGGETVRSSVLSNGGSGTMITTYASNAKILVEDCEILSGFSPFGLCCQASGSELMFRNNTFRSHVIASMYIPNATDFTYEFVDNIFYERLLWEHPDEIVPDSLSFRHNVYWDCSFRDSPEEFFVGGVGNFEADPLFCDGPPDHWLEPESPCIGAGETGETVGARLGVCGVTDVPDIQPQSQETELGQIRIWPNPSAGRVEIELRGFTGADVNASIFSVDGRHLVTIPAGRAGMLSWDAKIDGKLAPNGSYVVALRRGEELIAAEKLILSR